MGYREVTAQITVPITVPVTVQVTNQVTIEATVEKLVSSVCPMQHESLTHMTNPRGRLPVFAVDSASGHCTAFALASRLLCPETLKRADCQHAWLPLQNWLL